ncbi:hypothetical protein H7J71_02195 [Mycolicibacterium peregrinum]|uniref:hypothetical protein n=1 Tax=Mycolicibacterium peregrinum TaxID=43304 RepID=UPI0006D8633C|nr:hypothetical protein [Mycolicibacterium peregrinum]MCV7200822.1 hypothetical protein [Mycolicibacterium peregrinum]ORW49767.1 hypothetical protein AWC21_01705 [Mycolicibacterium peregrinum]
MTSSDPDDDQLAELLGDQLRYARERIAVFRESMGRLEVSGEVDGVRAVFGCGDALALREFTVAPQMLARCSSSDLADVIKTVLADAHQRFNEQFKELYRDLDLWGLLGWETSSTCPTVSSIRHVESSRSGDLLMSFDDRSVVADVYLAPAVVSTWTGQQVGERVQDMYTAALTAAVAREGAEMQRRGVEKLERLPSASEVTEYRRRYFDF